MVRDFIDKTAMLRGAQAEGGASGAAGEAAARALAQYAGGVQHIGIPAKDMAATEAFWLKLGFARIGSFQNGASAARFFKRGNLVIETWEAEQTAGQPGAINHIALDTEDAEALYPPLKAAGFTMIDERVQTLPFWEKGVKFFNIKGPNGEIVEFCERVK